MEEKNKIDADTDIIVLLHELSFAPIGISGKGRFVINPQFVATVSLHFYKKAKTETSYVINSFRILCKMCGTLLTYFIVTVQSGKH